MKPDAISKNKPLLKPSGRWMIAAGVIAAIAFGGAALQAISQFQRGSVNASNATANAPKTHAVSALGHLRPEGEIIYVSAPTVLNGSGVNRVANLLVKEGDTVKKGQTVAILDNYQTLEAAFKLAREDVEVAKAQLAKVKAGAKTGELEAQQATIARLQAESQGQLIAQDKTIARLKAEFDNGLTEYRRYQQLFQTGAVNASQLDSKRLTMTTAQEQLNEATVNRSRMEASFQQQIKSAQATLDQIAEVRPTDVQAAKAELNRAIANVSKAKAELELAYIRSPIDGQILKIHTRAGETVDKQGIVAIGQTAQMNVVAEVYELDVSKVHAGQAATITSNVFSSPLEGQVSEVGLQVNPQDVVSTDPTANVNNRIVEVKIRLKPEDSRKISALTNLQVNIVIHL